jgi:PHP domain
VNKFQIGDYHMHTTYSDGDDTINDMVEACISAGLSQMALTDHFHITGEFMHVPARFHGHSSIKSYLEEIYAANQTYQNSIVVHPGLEISSDIPPSLITERKSNIYQFLKKQLPYFSILLIEGWYIKNPIESAKILKQFLHSIGVGDFIPVVIAHPAFEDFSLKELQELIQLKIGVELNEAKFSRTTQEDLFDLWSQLSVNEQNELIFSTGSDAHDAYQAGCLKNVVSFILKHDMEKNLVKLNLIKFQ